MSSKPSDVFSHSKLPVATRRKRGHVEMEKSKEKEKAEDIPKEKNEGVTKEAKPRLSLRATRERMEEERKRKLEEAQEEKELEEQRQAIREQLAPFLESLDSPDFGYDPFTTASTTSSSSSPTSSSSSSSLLPDTQPLIFSPIFEDPKEEPKKMNFSVKLSDKVIPIIKGLDRESIKGIRELISQFRFAHLRRTISNQDYSLSITPPIERTLSGQSDSSDSTPKITHVPSDDEIRPQRAPSIPNIYLNSDINSFKYPEDGLWESTDTFTISFDYLKGMEENYLNDKQFLHVKPDQNFAKIANCLYLSPEELSKRLVSLVPYELKPKGSNKIPSKK